MKLSEWMKRSREERTAHIDLSTPCQPNPRKKSPKKSDILDFLGIEDDLSDWKEAKVERCHLCECNSRNGFCVNPLHFYIGTSKENSADRPQEYLVESGRRLGLMPKSDETKSRMSKSAKLRTDRDEVAKKVRKPVTLQRKSNGQIYYFESQKEAADVLGINMGNLSGVVNGSRASVNGFTLYS